MNRSEVRWYRLPLIWLCAAIFLASIAGCITMVVLASRYPDEPLPVSGDRLLKMPANHTRDSA